MNSFINHTDYFCESLINQSERKPILLSNSWYCVCFSLKTNRRARSFSFSSFALALLLLKCQVSEQ